MPSLQQKEEKTMQRSHGYFLWQCAVALLCIAFGLTYLLKLHVNALRFQKSIHAQTWAIIHAFNAQQLQQAVHASALLAWEAQVSATLPQPSTEIDWQPGGNIHLCWGASSCWGID